MRRNKKMSDDDLVTLCNNQFTQATGSEYASDELTTSRTNALAYYKGTLPAAPGDGKSSDVSKDVADMVDGLMTQIMEVFNTDDLVQFEAESEQDENQARTESKFVNSVVMEQNNGFILFESLVKDALLSKNCTAKVRVDINETVNKERYKELTNEEMFIVLQPTKDNQEIDVTMFDEGVGTVNLKRIDVKRKLVIDAVAPENFVVAANWTSPYLEECTYCAEQLWRTRSELIEEGYDAKVVDDLPASTSFNDSQNLERNTITSEDSFASTNHAMQMIELREHYIRVDQDGDGVTELHKVLTAGGTLLENTEVDDIPYANGIAYLMSHEYYGQSVYDKLKDVQDSKTFFLRQWHDNALVNNHKKIIAVEDDVNMDDLLNGRANGVIRVNNIQAITEMATADIGPSCQMALDYLDKVRTDRMGSTLDLQANSVPMPSNVGDAGVSTLIANLEKQAALVTTTLSETLVYSLYKLVHKSLRVNFPNAITKKFNGAWQQTVPEQWLERDQLNITVPPTPTQRVVQSVALEKSIVMGQGAMQSGEDGVTIDQNGIYQMKVDHMRMSGINNPEKYLINPDSPAAQQMLQQKNQAEQQAQQQIAQENAQLQQEQQAMQIKLLETQILEIQRNWESDKEDLEFNYTELFQKLAMEKYKTDVKADTDTGKTVADNMTRFEIENMKESDNGGDNAE